MIGPVWRVTLTDMGKINLAITKHINMIFVNTSYNIQYTKPYMANP